MAVKIVAHRGWPARFPDNVLAGFLAISGVADGIELDIRRSADGKLVVAHDPEIAGHVIAATPWSDLVELDLGDGHHPALLDEVLAAVSEIPVLLEVKNYPFQTGYEPDHRLALEAAERARPGDLVISFNPPTVAAVRRVFAEVSTGLAVAAGGDFDEAVVLSREAGHTAVIPAEVLIERPVEMADLEVFAWTVNDPVRARELAELGVSGIITDDAPRLARAIGSET
jgi:glycerophosphoryl diester phosphodiesterase